MKKIRIFIFGCSGIAKSIIDSLQGQYTLDHQSIVVVEKDKSLETSDFYRGVPAISYAAFERMRDEKDLFVIAFFKPENILDRLELADSMIGDRGLTPLTVIDTRAIISPTAKVAEGCYIGPGVVVDSNAEVGRHTTVLFNSVVSRDCCIAENNFISAGVVVKGGVRIGPSNFISASCNVLKNLGSHNFLNAGVRYASETLNSKIVFDASEQKEIVISDNRSTAYKQLRFLR